MAEEKEISVTGTVEDNTQDYLAAIKELKENSVNRSEYDKLRAENKRLIDAVVNGQPGQEEQVFVKHSKEQIDDLRNDLFNSPRELTNLEYVTKAMELREALIEMVNLIHSYQLVNKSVLQETILKVLKK